MRCVYVHVCVCEEEMVGGTIVEGESGIQTLALLEITHSNSQIILCSS